MLAATPRMPAEGTTGRPFDKLGPRAANGEQAFDGRVAAVRERIPSAQLYLKRSCTEFEMRAPSNTWKEADPFADAMVEFLSHWVEWDAETHEQTDYVEERVKSLWLERAYAIGDTSIAKVVPDFRSMFPQTVKYREAPTP